MIVKIKGTILLIVPVILFVYCDRNTKNKISLKGDWTSAPIKKGYNETPYIFSFEDSVCIAESPFRNYTSYTISDSLLKVLPDTANYPQDTLKTYILKKISPDSLILKSEQSNEVISLTKLNQQNNLNPEKILFASSGCFGTCPVIFLEIDNRKNFKFFGSRYTKFIGGYGGKISDDLYNQVLKKIRQINLSQLAKRYEAEWTDDQISDVVLKSKDSTIVTSVYGFDKEPAALRILLNYLQNIYLSIQLSKDSSVTKKYFEVQPAFTEISKGFLPPPVPPPVK